jgi:hypothetical protein
MRNILFFSNIVLMVASVILTMILLRSKPQPSSQPITADMIAEYDRSTDKLGKESKISSLRPDSKKFDNIWETNLFHPARNFEESQPNEIKISDEDEVKEHFELISIAQVSSRSCASIRVITENRNPKGASPPGFTNRNNRRRSTREQKPEKDQKVYQLNNSVGETGFVLSEIGIDYVILLKGDQEIKLTLDKSDEASEIRREVAYKTESEKAATLKKELMEAEKKNEQSRKRRKSQSDQADQKDAPNADESDNQKSPDNQSAPQSTPPPPPGAANPATSLNSNDEMSVRQQLIQRLKEQRERRRQQLQQERSDK